MPRGCGCRSSRPRGGPEVAHHEARHTPLGRWSSCVAWLRMARRSPRPRPGRTSRARPSAGGSTAGVGPASRIVGRWPASEPSEPSRCSPAQVPAEEAARICELRERTGWSPRWLADEPEVTRPHSKVHQVLRRAGVSRRLVPERPAVVRSEWPCPGRLLHMDVKEGSGISPSLATRPSATAPGVRGGSGGSTATRSSPNVRKLTTPLTGRAEHPGATASKKTR